MYPITRPHGYFTREMNTPAPAPDTPVSPIPVLPSKRRRAIEFTCAGVLAIASCALLGKAMMHQRTEIESSNMDASACLAAYNARDLIGDANTVPTSEFLANALGAVSLNAPVQVSVVRASPQSIAIVFPPLLATAYPGLASAYRSVSLSDMHSDTLRCPHSPEARELVSRIVSSADD